MAAQAHPTAQTESTSVIVRNVAASVEPPVHKILSEFFTFCGNISTLTLVKDDEDPSGNTLIAFVTFENAAAARTALLLNNALLCERAITVELAPVGFSLISDASSPQIALQPQANDISNPALPYQETVVTMLAKGYTLQKDALNTARKIDEDYAISKRASDLAEKAAQGIRNYDAEYGLSAVLKTWGDSLQFKAVELSQTYHVNEKTEMASQLLGNIGNSLGAGLQGAAHHTTEFVQQSPSLMNATEAIAQWGASLANIFQDAKTLSDKERPAPATATVAPASQLVPTGPAINQ